MTHNIIKFITVLAIGTMLFASCKKDNNSNEIIVGKWVNTAQSYEITIAGQENIPEGYITMDFTSNKVCVSDYRTDCLPEWYGYTISKESDKQLLEIENGCRSGIFVIEELSDDKLMLTPKSQDIDYDFRYVMKRYETSK